MEPYERLIGDALRGDRTLFGSEAGVEASWRIVDPILTGRSGVRIRLRKLRTVEAEQRAADAGGWLEPSIADGAGPQL